MARTNVNITNGDANVSAANAFYQVEAWNLGFQNATTLNPFTPRVVDITPANSGNAKGVVVGLQCSPLTPADRSIMIELEEAKATSMTLANPCVVTVTSHSFADGTPVVFTTTGTLPASVISGTEYFTCSTGVDTFNLYDTAANAIAGGANGRISTNGQSQSGTHTCWVTRTSNTQTATQITNGISNTGSDQWWVAFIFDAPYAVDTTASKWRIRVSQLTGGTTSWGLRTSNGTAMTFAFWCDNATSYVANDTFILKDVLTIDQNTTFKGVLGTGATAEAFALLICKSPVSSISNAGYGNLQWQFPTAASYTLTIDGCIIFGGHSGILIGKPITFTSVLAQDATSATLNAVWGYATDTYQICFSNGDRKNVTLTSGSNAVSWTGGLTSACIVNAFVAIPITKKAIISFPAPSVGTKCGITDTNDSLAIYVSKSSIWMIGEVPTYTRTSLASDAASGQAHIITTETTGWANGSSATMGSEQIWVAGAVVKGAYNDIAARYISNVSGTNITLNSNLTDTRKAGHKAMLVNCFGVQINGNPNPIPTFRLACPSNLVFEGVGFDTCFSNWVISNTSTTYWSNEDANKRSGYVFRNFSYGSTGGSTIILFQYILPPPEGFIIQYGNFWKSQSCWTNNGIWLYSTYAAYPSTPLVFDNNFICTSVNSLYPGTFTPDFCLNFTNNIVESIVYYVGIIGAKAVINNNKFWGGVNTAGILRIYNGVKVSGTSNTFDNCQVGLNLGQVSNGSLNDSVFGALSANVSDVSASEGGYVDFIMNNTTIGAGGITETYFPTFIPGSELKLTKYAGTLGDDRSWMQYGRYSTPSPNFNKLLGETYGTAANLSTQFKSSTQTITGKKVYNAVNVKISNAAYYGGVKTLPTLNVYQDANLTTPASYAAASANTNQQKLEVITTPTTDNNDVVIELLQKTDATEANSGVTWDTWVSNLRPYGYIFQSFTYPIKETNAAYLGFFTTPVVNPYITVTNPATVAGYGEFTIDHATQTVTISAGTTLKRLYDYAQYDLTLDANRGYAEWLTTLDGVNFVSTYNIVLNTGVDLTGGGTVNVGALTFTKTGTATYDGIIITSTNRSVHAVLNGLVAGSTVQVYDNDNTTELYNAVVAGTSLNYVYTWTADTELRIRIRQAGYIPYEYTGDITQTGLYLNVTQEVDAVYVANGIVGSTVTEFSLSGSTIMIYVDDPDNSTTAQRMYNWYMYVLATTTFIGIQPDDITAQTAWSYILADAIQISNQDVVNPVFITGANINNASNNGQVIYTAGGKININGYFPFNSVSDVAVANRVEMDNSSSKLKTITGLSAAAASK